MHDLPSATCKVVVPISLGITCFRFLVVVYVVFLNYMYCYRLIRLLETVHGGNNRKHEGITPLDQQEQEQLFTKAIEFPVKKSHAWNEKVMFRFCYLFP